MYDYIPSGALRRFEGTLMKEELVTLDSDIKSTLKVPTKDGEYNVVEVTSNVTEPFPVKVKRCAKHKDLYLTIPESLGIDENMEGDLYIGEEDGQKYIKIKNFRQA